ncbi:acetamidase/formamidase family protein [Planctomycetota bacterium]
MQVFKRESTKSHCVGALWPDFLGEVELRESFIIETESCDPNGPIAISGIKASDNIAVHIEAIEMVGPFYAPNGGPFHEGCGDMVPLEYRDGYFYWPKHFRLKAKPSVGNVAILPKKTDEVMEAIKEFNYGGRQWKNEIGWRRVVRHPRDKNCHQDGFAITAGSVVHFKAQVDQAGICLDDVHGYIGQGEMAFAGIEVQAKVQVRVERSTDWHVDWPIIETENEIMVFSSYTSTYIHRPKLEYVDIVREAYRAMREVVAAKIGGTIEEANTIVATAVDIKNCALYGLKGFISQEESPETSDIAVVASLPKDVLVVN